MRFTGVVPRTKIETQLTKPPRAIDNMCCSRFFFNYFIYYGATCIF